MKAIRAKFLKIEKTQAAANELCRIKNRAFAAAGNRRDVAAVVEHPEGWAVMDLTSAIAVGVGYSWYV